MPEDPRQLRFALNGAEVREQGDAAESAAQLLRRLGLTSIKLGCGQGACGCCTALVDGKPRPTCRLPAARLHGRSVTTLEGLPTAERELLARAFGETGGLQCGFCTPGIALRTSHLLDQHPDPAGDTVKRALSAHVCRCTGWHGIFRAVQRAAELRGAWTPAPAGEHIGDSAPRYQARELALGLKPFIADRSVPGMLHGALVTSPYPRCRILGIDTSRALALPGVHAVVTAADVPGERHLGLIRQDWPPLVAVGEQTRTVGDVLAAVAADSQALAREAAALVRIEAQPLEPVLDLELARQDPANILARSVIRRGEVDAALASSAVVVRESFRTQRVDHGFLEPEAALAWPTDAGLQLLSCGQGIFDDHRQLCRFLALPPEALVVELGGAGGAFGGREDLSVQPHACLLALVTGRPVRLVLSMEESLRQHPKRHPLLMEYTLGADAQGRITALRARIWGDTGGHASVGEKVLERAAGHAGGPYRVPAADVVATTVLTNNPVAGAMRGFGANQVAFALEGCLERIAARLGIDPWQIRHRNAARPGDPLVSGQRAGPGAGIVATLDAIRPHYDRARAEGKAVGLACGLKNVGLGNGHPETGKALLEVRSASEIAIYTGFTEMGQGHTTILRQMAAELTGLPSALFTVATDTSAPVDVGMTTSSRATFLGGWGMRRAAEPFNQALRAAGGQLSLLVGQRFEGLWQAPQTQPPQSDRDEPNLHFAYAWASQLAILDAGGRLEEIVAAHDVGRAINPLSCQGQVEGGVHMGAGQALTELLRVEGGWPDTRYRALGILPARHTPLVTTLLVEVPAEHGPWGAKGIGEVCLVPTAPAIAHAIHAFDGSWPTRLPMADSPPARALHRRSTEER